jgi:hypothetical protein
LKRKEVMTNNTGRNTMTQLKLTKPIKSFVAGMKLETLDDLIELKVKMRTALETITYEESIVGEIRRIMWKRTAHQILEDGYIYSKDSCTDIVILFMALCKALGLKTFFVKVRKKNGAPEMHSIAEIRLPKPYGWYLFDLAYDNPPEKGRMTPGSVYRGWEFWKKGRDSWDLGLWKYGDRYKIFRRNKTAA